MDGGRTSLGYSCVLFNAVKICQLYITTSFFLLHPSSAFLTATCIDGSSVNFGHPCPANVCYFQKHFHTDKIFADGTVKDPRFAMNDEGTHIILKECNEDDEGTYVWTCEGCGGQTYNLAVIKVTRELLYCTIGNQVSFKFNCSGDLRSCSFEQLSNGGNMLHNGNFSDQNPRYQFGEDKNDVILVDCSVEDEGMFTWQCDSCNILHQFNLTIKIPVLSKGISIKTPSPAILSVSAVIVAYYYWKT